MDQEFLPMGRQISSSKTAPKGQVCVFNANICIKSKGNIWFGDLNLTRDVELLVAFAKAKGETLYILKERDARFTNEANPRYENAVATVSPTTGMEFTEAQVATLAALLAEITGEKADG
jgi:hypothetical protein